MVATLSMGYKIMGASTVNAAQMAAYYRSSGKTFPADIYASKGAANIDEFCKIVVEEAAAEGVRAEVLFAQICLETGFLPEAELRETSFRMSEPVFVHRCST